MPFPLPPPQELTRRQEAAMERALTDHALLKGLDVSPQAIARAIRSPHGLLSAIVRNNALLLYEAHLHLRWLGDQLFPDTAALENLSRHAGVWGLVQRPATSAVGYARVTGRPGTSIPADFDFIAPQGQMVRVSAAGEVGEDGSVLLAVASTFPGDGGNVPPHCKLSPVTPLADIRDARTDADGLAGGAAPESAASLLDRLLEQIRQPPHGGAKFDYQVWVQNRFPAARVRTLPTWPEPGAVGVVVAMGTHASPRVPTPAELAAIRGWLLECRPVTADVDVYAAELVPVPITISIQPDEINVRRAIEAAISSFFSKEATIGGKLHRSRLSEAISSAAGEYAHILHDPGGDLTSGHMQLLIPGTVTWEAEK